MTRSILRINRFASSMSWGLVCLLMLFFPKLGSAQVDSLSLEEYYQLIRANHPVAQQAELIPREAAARIRLARGAFDPKLVADADQKMFEGTNYYRHIDGGLKVMTLPGIEVKAGYEQGLGERLNPEAYTPSEGLVYAGISVPLGQGLLIDGRRAALKQAKIFRESTTAQQMSLLNELIFDATKAYWEWSEAYAALQVQNRAVEIAEIRYNATVQDFKFGDKAAVDTLEALIQLQNRQQSQLSANLSENQTRLKVSNYLWNEAGQALVVDASLYPERITLAPNLDGEVLDSALVWLEGLTDNHPELQLLRYKLAELEVERRLKADKLKPKIYAQYNVLNRPLLVGENPAEVYPNVFENNYKWGLQFSFPLFLRQERGNLEVTRLKIQDTQFKQDQKRLELNNKVLNYLAELEILTDQINLARVNVTNYQRLLEAEVLNFQAGESSLFLLNSRETKLIESQLKLVELQAKYRKASASIAWSAGVLGGAGL